MNKDENGFYLGDADRIRRAKEVRDMNNDIDTSIVFWDVDTQIDFMDAKGKLPVPNADSIRGNLKKLTLCGTYGVNPILSSRDRHFEDDMEMEKFPPHCMSGSIGYRNIPETTVKDECIFANKIRDCGVFEKYTYVDIMLTLMLQPKKVVFEKQTTDVFTNPHIDRVLDKIGITDVYIYGVATEYCVKDAVIGFLKRGYKVYLVTDAIMGIDNKDSHIAQDYMLKEGAIPIPTRRTLKYMSPWYDD